ncbi:MAG: cytochrome c3 family protein [Candidatus Mariimomonas ferrooxydans]
MSKKKNRVSAGLFLLSFLIIFASGCDKYTRHKVLTFFFTGVPPLEGEVEKKAGEVQGGKAVKRRSISEVKYFIHGPYSAGECDQCHESSSTYSFTTGSKKKAGVTSGVKGGLPGRLVLPLKKLCIECHVAKSAQRAYVNGLVTHGPLATGSCTLCHDPHRSPFQYMLLKEKSIDLCTQCHSKGYLLEKEEHAKNKDCISCHNPHIGKNSFLLKKDFNEVF